ncbi:hypothetical protein LINPERHAP1_LOCUS38133, partial [Linum perenne]
ENYKPNRGVVIEEIDGDEEPHQTTSVLGKRKSGESSALLLEWKEDFTPAIGPQRAKDSRAEALDTASIPVSPVVNERTPVNSNAPVDNDSDEDDRSGDDSLDLTDSDVDIYDDIDVQERFEMDKMWQESETRNNQNSDLSGEERLSDEQQPSASRPRSDEGSGGDKEARVSGERNCDRGSSGSGAPRSGERTSDRGSSGFRINPEPNDVDSDMETDDTGFAKRLVFDSDEEDDNGGPSFPEFNRELNLDNPEFQNGLIQMSLGGFI